jgi:hypothetical protein
VDVLFYDTPSRHSEINDEESGDEQGQVQGSQAAGEKT